MLSRWASFGPGQVGLAIHLYPTPADGPTSYPVLDESDYRYYLRTIVGGKYLCTVVKVSETDAFVLTAYLTDRIKRGETLWPANPSG
jgi:hypothetical protein